MSNAGRILHVLNTVARYRLLALLPGHPLVWPARALLWLFPARWLPAPTAPAAARLRLALEELGPIFIKLGQLLATRRDLFDDAVCDELAKLQDQVAPFPDSIAHAMIARALGTPVPEAFTRIEATPLAAASVAQVYAAQLVDGTDVVIKLLRPGIAAAIEADLSVMRMLAGVLESTWPEARLFRPAHIVAQYADTIHAEIDLRREAQNSERMRLAFERSPLLYVPRMHMHLVRETMLVMDRMHGIPVTDTAAIDALGIDRRLLATRGVEIFFTQVFRDNFFHADMHPGNVYVETGNPSDPRFIGLDCAIVGSLPTDDQLTIAQIALSLIQRDFSQLIRIAAQAGWVPAGAPMDLLIQEVRRLVEPVLSKPIDQVQLAPILAGLLELARTHELQIPPQFVLLLKTLIHVEGLGRDLYPQLDIWSLAQPLLKQWLQDRIGPRALLRRITEDTPILLAGLPEMPQLIFDALTQMRQTGQWQSRQLAELKLLQRQLRDGRRQDFLAWAGIIAGTGVALAAGNGMLVLAGALPLGLGLIGLSLAWRLLAK